MVRGGPCGARFAPAGPGDPGFLRHGREPVLSRRSAPRGPRLTVDAWVRDGRGRLLLVRRGRPPFQGSWALPGGFCELGESTEVACAREVEEETGVRARIGAVLGVYSDPKRDPRGHSVSVLYAATSIGGTVRAGDDACDARWFTRKDLRGLELAFDHGRIVREQLARRRGRRSAPSGRPAPRKEVRPGLARRGGARE
ncbi:MAG TPA: NUDIX hydrolase [Thermoanaerobaculia bacterium]